MAMCEMELALLERQMTIKAGERLFLIVAILAQCFDSILNFLVFLVFWSRSFKNGYI
jgi:hypothetical protein